jgi:hypothetical protein
MFKHLYNKLPLLNFIIASTAFAFQTNVLYPWHKQLSLQIEKLERKNKYGSIN